MTQEFYREYQLGPFTEFRRVVSKLSKRFPGRYQLEHSGAAENGDLWLLVEQSEDERYCVMFLVMDGQTYVIGEDAFKAIERILIQVL